MLYLKTTNKANKLIQASYGRMPLYEQLILVACISFCDPEELTEDTCIELTVKDFATICGIKPAQAYGEFKKTEKRLFDRKVFIDTPENPKLTRAKVHWVRKINYYKGSGKIGLYFDPDIIPYLAQLREKFTRYKLRHVANFKSAYGIRLYELLVQWKNKGYREIELDWLRERWQLGKGYSRIGNLKARVITPAVRDINEHSNLWVDYSQRKEGRYVVAFKFRFGSRPQKGKKHGKRKP